MSVKSFSQSGRMSQSRLQRPKTTLSNSAPIEIFPPEIFFKDIEVEQTYEITVSVRNLSQRVRRIRFIPPKTSKFVAEYETLGSIAGGIQTTVVISFETDIMGDFHDELVIVSEDFSYTLLLHAYQPGPDIQFNKFLDLGLTPIGQPLSDFITFSNTGSKAGRVTINIDKSNSPQLTVQPETFLLHANETINVQFNYDPHEVEVFRDPVIVEIEGQDTAFHIDVNATCVEHQMCVVAPNMELVSKAVQDEMDQEANLAVTTSLNFGHLYHGQIKEIDAYLFNNGPITAPFNIRFIQGSEEDAETDQFITSTPQEIARQELKRVMRAEPSTGLVEPYSRIPIKFVCHSKVNPRNKGFNHNALEEGGAAELSQTDMIDNVVDHFYTAIFSFGNVLDQRLFLQLQARAIYPNIKISHNSIFFPPCPVHDQRDYLIKIDNLNEELPVDFSFTRAAQFSVKPDKGVLFPSQSKSLTFTFKPNNLGVFHENVKFEMIKGSYQIPIHLYGKCAGISEKQSKLRGPGCNTSDFLPDRKYIGDEDISLYNLNKPKSAKTKDPQIGDQVENLIMTQLVKQTYVDFLRQSRQKRIIEQKVLKNQHIPAKTIEEIEADPNLGMGPNRIRGSAMTLPKIQETLFTNQPTGILEGKSLRKFDPDKPVKNVSKKPINRKKFVEVPYALQPIKQIEIRECNQELKPEQLQYISSGPRIIKFDRVVMSQKVEKWFTVVNDLKQSIFVQVYPDLSEIRAIDPQSLVIPASSTGGFKIIFQSDRNQVLEHVIQYTINNHHQFNFKLVAKIEKAVLKLSKPQLHFVFEDEMMEESLYERIIVENHCRADTKFNWMIPKRSNFEIEPMEDIVPAEKSKTVLVKFTPSLTGNKEMQEMLTMQVEHGDPQQLICQGDFTEARCTLLQREVQFGTVSVGLKNEQVITLKNMLRTSAVFHIKRCPQYITVTPARDKLKGDGRINIRVDFLAQEETKLNSQLEICIRGGKSLFLPLIGNAIIPQVYIQEPEINFGGITCKNSGIQKFTIVNESPIEAIVFLSLEEHKVFEVHLDQERLGEGENDGNLMQPANNDKLNPFYTKEEEDELEAFENMEEEEDSEGEVEEIIRSFRFQIRPNSSLPLTLQFTPNDVENYLIELPIRMAGINDPIKGLTRIVIGEGLQPRLIIDYGVGVDFTKNIVDFGKKYLSIGDKSFPDYKDNIKFVNPDVYPVKWYIKTDHIVDDNVFSIRPTNGSIEPNDSCLVRFGFNPAEAREYDEKVELYLDESTEPYLIISLRGEGSIPRISFDRRQVIMPIVPIGIQSKSTFKIINEGYQNVELSFRLPKDPGRIPINIAFPDGQTLGSARKRISVEVSFTSDRSMSFTAIMELMDNDGNRFHISISGTSDNSLFTNFPFFQRHPEDFQFQRSENGAIMLNYEELSDPEEYSGRWGGPRTSAASSVMSRSVRSIIGYVPIPQVLLEKGLEYLTRFLNHSVLTSTITKFPDDFINSHGQQLYEMIQILTGRTPPGYVRNIHTVQHKELTNVLIKQYDELINYLKKNGAYLNTIRPEFLLSQNDFAKYLKSTPNELQLRPKQIQYRWPYISMDAWTTLIYQVIKIFLLNRVNPRQYKSLPGIAQESAVVEASASLSNIFSLSEVILLKWLSYHYGCIHPLTPKDIINFDKDLMDGTVLAAAIQNHVGNVKSLQNLRVSPNSEDQRLANCEKVINALSEIGMTSNISAMDLARPSQRECLLFVLQLYQGLPHYIPKQTITFPCILGEKVTKTIELTNPAGRPVSYFVNLEGSTDFFVDENIEYVTIPSRSTNNFPVYFQSRITQPVQKGKLSFTHRSTEGGAPAAALVFMLQGNVHSRVSIETYEMETPLYKLLQKEIEVKNTSNIDAEYTIKVIHLEKQTPIKVQNNRRNASMIQEGSSLQFPSPFFIKNEKVKVRKNSSTYVAVQFLPFEMDIHQAYIIFCDEKVGEQQYTLVGKVKLPEPYEIPAIKGEMGSNVNIDVPLEPRNRLFELAKAKCRERFQSSNKAKEREQLNEIFKKLQAEDSNVFDVQITSPYFSGPNTITIQDLGRQKGVMGEGSVLQSESRMDNTSRTSKKSQSKFQKSSASKENTLTMSCTPKSPGEFICEVIFTSLKKTDIRVYEITLQAKPKRTVATLEMTTEARGTVTQDIPIINNSNRDWQIKTRLEQSEPEYFTATKDFTVRKGNTGYCTVQFQPQ